MSRTVTNCYNPYGNSATLAWYDRNMTTPRRTIDSYPPAFLSAVQRAFSVGQHVIPCKSASPASVRMQFYGFLKALGNSGQTELAESISILTDKEGRTITLIRKELTAVAGDIFASLDSSPVSPGAPLDDADSLFDRLGN